MDTTSKAAPKTGRKTTRKHVVNGRYAALLAEDFRLDWAVVVEALIGEPYKTGMALCEWASTKREPAKALTAWARKNRRGTYRPAPAACAPADSAPRPGGKRCPAEITVGKPRWGRGITRPDGVWHAYHRWRGRLLRGRTKDGPARGAP